MSSVPITDFPAVPLANSYWVLPGRMLAGEYPGAPLDADTDERIDRLLQAGVDAFIDLTAPGELTPYHPRLPLSVEYDRRPIDDHGIPENFQQMNEIVDLIQDALRRQRTVYVHCRAGIGRTGMSVACHLAAGGLSGAQALDELNRLWPQSGRSMSYVAVPETREQAEFVHEWARLRATLAVAPAAAEESPPAVIEEVLNLARTPIVMQRLPSRFAGCLLGLAIGEAAGAAAQGQTRGSFAPIDALVGGGPDGLQPGAWADDTAMALCLADSLLATAKFDPRDQVERYQRWQTQGYLSAGGRCVGITPNTVKSLSAARWRRQQFAGSHDPAQLDPEVLSRAAPVAMYFQGAPREALERAGEAARATNQAPLVLAAMRCAASVLLRMFAGQDRSGLLALNAAEIAIPSVPGAERLTQVVAGEFRSLKPEQLRPDGDILDVLTASLWASWRARDFRDAVLLAVNLGGRSDVCGALTGQIAGARFGVDAIPADWLNVLVQRELIAQYAERLCAAALARSPP
jgi:ADP-ribosyl-[dinitrogen reductase] hydrolase